MLIRGVVAFVSHGNLHFLSLPLMMMIRLGPSDDGDDGDDDNHRSSYITIIWVTWNEMIKINICENLSTAVCRADIKLAERFSLHQLQHQPPNTQRKYANTIKYKTSCKNTNKKYTTQVQKDMEG